jgi:hypothetical protein
VVAVAMEAGEPAHVRIFWSKGSLSRVLGVLTTNFESVLGISDSTGSPSTPRRIAGV